MERQTISDVQAKELLVTGEGVIVNAGQLERLMADRDALAARVAELEGAGERLCNFAWSGVTVSWNRKDRASEAEAYLQANIDAMRAALTSTAPQSLARVKAAAVRSAAYEIDGPMVGDAAQQLERIAARLESEAANG